MRNTPWEYDSNAYENLPDARKRFWDRKKNITISQGIRNSISGRQIYMRVRKIGSPEPKYYESELSKNHIDKAFGPSDIVFMVGYDNKILTNYDNKKLIRY